MTIANSINTVLLPTIYVSSTGSDIQGTGAISNPYATYEFARTQIAPFATATNPYTIGMIGVFDIVGDMTLSAFVNVSGIGTSVSIINVSGQVILGASFEVTVAPVCHIQNVILNVAGNISLLFGAYQDATIHFDNVDFKSTPQFIATGLGATTLCELVLIENCISIVTQPAFIFTNIRAAIVNSNVTTTTAINSSTITQNFFILTAPVGNMGACTLQTNSTGTMTAILQGCINLGSAVTLNGTSSTLYIDSASYGVAPTFLGGATSAQVNFVSLADGLAANVNFTPVNYVPTAGANYKANSITGNLKGIDDAILAAGGVASVAGTTNQIDVTPGANPVLSIPTTFNVPANMTVAGITFSGGVISSPSIINYTAPVVVFGATVAIGSGNFFRMYNSTNTFKTNITAASMVSDATYTLPPALPAGNGYTISSTAAGVWTWVPMPPPSMFAVGGRLTLTSNTPVTTADVLAATTLYFTPYRGVDIDLYTGTGWMRLQINQLSIAVPATTNTMYDVFVNYNAGTPILSVVAWSTLTTRATGLVYQNGVLILNGDATRRYVGSFSTTGVSGQTEDSAVKRYVWNYYNRIEKHMYVAEAIASWVYTTATWRQARANTANQVDFVIGVSEDTVYVNLAAPWANTTPGGTAAISLGLDSITAPAAAPATRTIGQTGAAGSVFTLQATYNGYPGIGRHYLAWLEFSQAAGVSTFYGGGTLGVVTFSSGIQGRIFC